MERSKLYLRYRYVPDIVDVRSFIVLILVVWRNKNKIKVCLIIFAFDVSRVRCHVSPSWHPALITLALLTSLCVWDSVTLMRSTNTELADVTRHVACHEVVTRLFPGPRLSPHWPRVPGVRENSPRLRPGLRGPDTRQTETRARDNTRAGWPHLAQCSQDYVAFFCEILMRKNITLCITF